MKKMNIIVITFDTTRLPFNSHGASFPKTGEYLTKVQFVPAVGTRIGVEEEKELIDENPKIANYSPPEEYVVVTGVTLRPWLDEIQIEVKFE